MPSTCYRRSVLFLALLSASFSAPGPADGAAGEAGGGGDAAAMQALRRALAPPGWGPGADHCAWRGVTCSPAAAGAVTAIELPRRGLRGDFSAASSLRALARLDLSANSLSGALPPALGALARLEFLDLSMNALTGAVPAALAGASGLRFLNLSNNALSGGIPDELRALRALQELQISGNNLTGALPGWLAGLPALRVLSAYENALSGPIPPGLGLSSELQVLNLHSNALEGAIPSSLFERGNLQVLILTLNRLNGTIPDAIGRCGGLSNVRIGDNLLSGAIPASVGDATSLTYFEANTNDLSGGIPTQFARCANLTLLNLANNRLAGEVPDVLGELRSLQELIASGNGLGGEFPRSILRCRNLSKLDLSYNAFRGDLPENICNGSRMQFLLLDHNEFSGGIPAGIGGCTRLLELQLGNNNLSGEIPAEIGKVKSLQIALNLSFNHFTGPLPHELGRLDKLVMLDLSSNEISGQIPSDMRGMLSLIEVNLSNNRLSGAIPVFGPFQKSAASSFSGNAKLCGDPLNVDCGSIYGSNYGMDHRGISYRVALAVVGSCVLIFSLVSLVVALFMWRERQEKEEEAKKAEAGEVVVAAPQVGASAVFIESLQQAIDFQSCIKATFKDANEVSNGTFSTTYKAVMPSGMVVCVKKLKSVDRAVIHQQEKMVRELERFSHINHKNLVRPIGFVIYDDVALLLHHHMPNGTLLQLLHNGGDTDGEKQKPDWPRLLSIAIDVAEGLAFLPVADLAQELRRQALRLCGCKCMELERTCIKQTTLAVNGTEKRTKSLLHYWDYLPRDANRRDELGAEPLDGRLLADLEVGLPEAKPLRRRSRLRAEWPLAGVQIRGEGATARGETVGRGAAGAGGRRPGGGAADGRRGGRRAESGDRDLARLHVAGAEERRRIGRAGKRAACHPKAVTLGALLGRCWKAMAQSQAPGLSRSPSSQTEGKQHRAAAVVFNLTPPSTEASSGMQGRGARPQGPRAAAPARPSGGSASACK